eukprot:scaffold24191_cov69-Phaeocystis_antarctica.AAC.5
MLTHPLVVQLPALTWRLIIHALDAALRCPPERRPRRRRAHVESVTIPRLRRRPCVRRVRLRRRALAERVPWVRRPIEFLVALLRRGGRDGVVRCGARAVVCVAVRTVLATQLGVERLGTVGAWVRARAWVRVKAGVRVRGRVRVRVKARARAQRRALKSSSWSSKRL